MSDLATLIAQLSGSNQQPASDPAMAAVKLARASLDALVLKLGQTIDAKVVGQLTAGLTQLSTANESFVLKLETPVPAGTAVTIRVASTPQGTPAITVSVPAAAPHAAPLQVATPTAPLVQAPAPQTTVQPAPALQPLPQAAQLPLAAPVAQPTTAQVLQPAPQVVTPAHKPAAHASSTADQAAVVAQPRGNVPQTPNTATPLPQTVPPAATPVAAPAAAPVPPAIPTVPVVASFLPAPAQPAAQVPLPVGTTPQPPAASQVQPTPAPTIQPAAFPASPLVTGAARVATTPVVSTIAQAPIPAAPGRPGSRPPATAQPAPILTATLVAQPQQPLPTHPSPYPVHVPHPVAPVVAQQLPLPAATAAAPRPAAPPLNLADPAQAAARQDSVAPLLARLAAIVTAAAPSVPRSVLEAAQRLLANRIDLNRSAPDGKTLESAVLKAGVLLTPPSREAPGDSKSALLALRSTLLAFLGDDASAPAATVARAAPPIKGEPPRAPLPQPALPDTSDDGHETARTLLAHTDAALSRLKLLQSASQPVDARIDAPAPRSELRVEIPMLLGAETGILQLTVERDGKHKREPERQRGWRMRFAMSFTQTGEVGADITMLGRSTSIAIWAADPDTAEVLDEMLPELAPAIQRHGLELVSLRVRRGAPQHARVAPGQLLDSAR